MDDEEIKEQLAQIWEVGECGKKILNEIAFHSTMYEEAEDSEEYTIWLLTNKMLSPENYPDEDFVKGL